MSTIQPSSIQPSTVPTSSTGLITQAGRLGLVTQRELAGGWVSVHGPLGCRHVTSTAQTYAVSVRSHPVGYVKLGPSLHRERAVLTALADRECTAELVADSDRMDGDQLWTSVADGTDLSGVRGNTSELVEICEAWGAALGRLHTTPVLSVRGATVSRPPRARPWVLDERVLTRTVDRGREGTGFATVVRSLETGALRAAAAEVAERWTATHWVHGDLRPEHVLVSGGDVSRVRFVGLGYAGIGDPAWDLAAAYDALENVCGAWSLPFTLGVESFLQGYRDAGGPARLYPAMQAVHALASAWEQAELGASTDVVTGWVDRARHHAGRVWTTGQAA